MLKSIRNFTSKCEYAHDIYVFWEFIIRMYYAPKEHNPPHIHVFYQDYSAVLLIENGKITDGTLPNKQLKFVAAWMEIHKDEMLADWNLCQNGEKPFTINPLN